MSQLLDSCWSPEDYGSRLETWVKTGPFGQFASRVTRSNKQYITRLTDLSPTGRDWVNETGVRDAGYRVGLTLSASEGGPWSTPLPLIAQHKFPDNTQTYANSYYYDAPLVLPGEFVLWIVLANSRGAAPRDIWGTEPENGVYYNQGSGAVHVIINGTDVQLTANGFPLGVYQMAIRRTAANVIKIAANGVQVGSNPTLAGTLTLGGFGFMGRPNHGQATFDDYAFEAAAIKGSSTAAEWDLLHTHGHRSWRLPTLALGQF